MWFLNTNCNELNSVVLITGASTGIGLALAKKLKKTNYRLVLTAREASLHRFKDAGIEPDSKTLLLPLDINHPHQRMHTIDEIKRQWGGVDILINNAGISYRAVVEHMNNKEELHQINTNYLSAMALIRLVLPHMREQGYGRIINVSSVSGMMAMPTMSAYSASKFALEGASESLWYEAKPWGIKVSLIEPGFVHSNSFEHVYHSRQSAVCETKHVGPYIEYYDSMEPFIRRMMRWSRSTPEKVAQKIIKTMQKKNPRLRVPATLDAHVFYWLRRLLPRALYHRLLFWGLPGIQRWGNRR